MFWPRSTTNTPGPHLGDRDRTELLDRRHRRGRRADQGVVPAVADDDRRPVRLDGQEPAVLVLALDQVGLGDVRGGPAPGRVGADDGRRAVLVLEVQLRQERRLGAPLVVGVEHADLAAVPAVGQQRLDHVGAGRQQGRHVVGLDLRVRGVLRVAGRQLVRPDPLPVDGRPRRSRARSRRGAHGRRAGRPRPRRAAGTPAGAPPVPPRRRWRSRRPTSRRGRAARPRRPAARTTRRARPRSRRGPAPRGVRPRPAPCPATAPARGRRPRRARWCRRRARPRRRAARRTPRAARHESRGSRSPMPRARSRCSARSCTGPPSRPRRRTGTSVGGYQRSA